MIGMRISTLTNWAYAVTLVLTGLSGAAFINAAAAAREERRAIEEHLRLDVVAEELAFEVERLTDEARLYVMRGDARHLAAYRREREVVASLNASLLRARAADLHPHERAAIDAAERRLAELQAGEDRAVAAAEAGRIEEARLGLFGPEHERAQSAVLAPIQTFRELVSARTESQMREARRNADRAGFAARVALGLTALLFLAVLYFVLRRRVSLPLTRMAGIVTRLARQDYDVEVPDDRRRDEIGDMTKAIQVFRDNGLERDRLEAERRADQQMKDALLQMVHRLQACESRAELGEVVACFAPQAFPDLSGALYGLDDRRGVLVRAAVWLQPDHAADEFPLTACWGLRRGRAHFSNAEAHDIACPHIGPGATPSLCLPLSAHGETIGLLYFEAHADVSSTRSRLFTDLMADNIALTLANLRLRERLADLAERDGLTRLRNRRALDQRLAALAPEAAVACLMIDIDHFKRFNDTFGHDAGDAVMQHVAEIMRETLKPEAAAYRFGGEEFTVLIDGCDAAAAMEQAETLRRRIADAALAHHGRLLGRITVSIGIAAAPEHGPPATLLRQADGALLQAKTLGRDRTMSAQGGSIEGSQHGTVPPRKLG